MPYTMRTRLGHRFKTNTAQSPGVVRNSEHTIHHADFDLVLTAAKASIASNNQVEVSDIGDVSISRLWANLHGVIGLAENEETYNHKLNLFQFNNITGTSNYAHDRCAFVITADYKTYGVATLIFGSDIKTFDRSI
ncbi:hypothetical protein [Vibrio coralliirubri]|uniref:hypothetical protein n=1 Tax=Vibrio coralliirubri TaxID=1516159 RepID=UPI000A3A73B0|nr:hypothetical protein [Vibrio coralliirubri]